MAGWFSSLFSRRKVARHADSLEWSKARYHIFLALFADNERILAAMAEADRLLYENEAERLAVVLEELGDTALELADALNRLTEGGQRDIYPRLAGVRAQLLAASEQFGRAPRGVWMPLAAVTPDMREQAGGKALPLAGLIRAGVTVPDGVVIPRRSCQLYLRQARLEERLGAILFDAAGEDADLEALAKRARTMILASDPTPEFAGEMRNAWASLAGGGPLAISVRSSASGEDGREHSFAGQYTSVLGVRSPEAFIDAFKEVLAGAFSPRAMAYRIKAGLGRQSVDMAVLCQRMVEARTAGVLFTADPMAQNDRMLLTAVPGLGELAVSGRAPADVYHPSRQVSSDGDGQMPCEIAAKTHRLVQAEGGGVRLEEVGQAESREPLLAAAEIEALRLTALRIEALAGCVQDIEWSIDHNGILWILQARPAHLAKAGMSGNGIAAKILLDGGAGVSPGKATGIVALVGSAEDLAGISDMEEPVIAVLPRSLSLTDGLSLPPNLVGIIADKGDPLDRMACLAREKAMPMIIGLGTATSVLRPGQWVLADGDRGAVLEADARLWQGAARRYVAAGTARGDGSGAVEAIRGLIMGPGESLRDITDTIREKATFVLNEMTDALCGIGACGRDSAPEKIAALDRFLYASRHSSLSS